MRPILFSLFGIPFASWYVFFALAATGGFFYAQALLTRARNRTALAALPPLFIICYLAGWVGARSLSILVEQFEVRTLGAFVVELGRFGPMTFYGGALLSLAAGMTYVVVGRKPVGILVDALVPAGVLALGIGRIGCHLNGDDYGLPLPDQTGGAAPWWAVTFPTLGDGLARYPVQIEEALFSFLIAAAAAWVFLRKYVRRGLPGLACGQIACASAFLSAANRFTNEFFRGDARGTFFMTSLSTSQGVAIIIMAGTCLCSLWLGFKAREGETL